MPRDLLRLAASLVAIAVVTFVFTEWLHVTNATITALSFLIVVVIAAATSRLWVAVTTSLVAMACLNFFFLPPVGTWNIADTENWIALFAFLGVSLVASSLSSAAYARAQEAEARAQLVEERKAADLARQGEELKSALLASLGHDLRTPLTAIRVAASNLQASWLTPGERQEQGIIVLTEVERLTRLFQNILDMARIDAGAVSAEIRWVHPSEIVSAARDLVPEALRDRPLNVDVKTDALVKVDPRLTAAALSHVFENAAQYSSPGSPIDVVAAVHSTGLTLTVRDYGAGIPAQDLPHLFDRFYRGGHARGRAVGTGMGLTIARGLVAAEHGRISAENHPAGGAQFTIEVLAESTKTVPELVES